MSLLDSILGTFNSGYQPEDQVSTAPTDPYGNPVGGPAPGVPLPRPRPPEAGLAAFSPGLSPPDMQRGEFGGLAAALGLDPARAKTVMAALAGGLSNVKNSPFAGQVAANAAGGAIAGGNKAQDTAIEQAIKLQRVTQIGLKRADAASERWYRGRVAALRDEQRAINQSAQTPEQKAAQYKSLQGRARALAAEFETIKVQNRRAHGLSDDGTPLPQVDASAVPDSAAPTSGDPDVVQ